MGPQLLHRCYQKLLQAEACVEGLQLCGEVGR